MSKGSKGGKEQIRENAVRGEAKRNNISRVSMQQKMSGLKIWQLIVLLVVVICAVVLFVGAAAGWFSSTRVVLDTEYECSEKCDSAVIDIGIPEYDKLVSEEKSFVLLVDQTGCKTAERLRGFMKDYFDGTDVKYYRLMFSDLKESSLYNYVKYYPSVVLVSDGKPVAWLRADENADADKYNNYDSFKSWLQGYLK